MFLGLYDYHHRTGEPTPTLALSHSKNKDASEYTFKLRRDVHWVKTENNKIIKLRPVTAHDFVYSIRRILSPELASEYAYMVYVVKNGEDYNKGKIKDPKKTRCGSC